MLEENLEQKAKDERIARRVLLICFLASWPIAYLISLLFPTTVLYAVGGRALTLRDYWTLWAIPSATFILFTFVWMMRYVLTSNHSNSPRETIGGLFFFGGLGVSFVVPAVLILPLMNSLPDSLVDHFGRSNILLAMSISGLILAPVAYYLIFQKYVVQCFEDREKAPLPIQEFLNWRTHRIGLVL